MKWVQFLKGYQNSEACKGRKSWREQEYGQYVVSTHSDGNFTRVLIVYTITSKNRQLFFRDCFSTINQNGGANKKMFWCQHFP